MRIGILLLVVSSIAHADPADDPEHKRADALFDEAKALLDAGKLDEACAKFEESLSHDKNAIGTLLQIARCDARHDKLASAVATYTDVRDRAKLQNAPEYAQVADAEITRLTPFVPHLAITVADPPEGFELTVDDKPLALSVAADLGVDPGSHTIAARAPGYKPLEERITINKKERKPVSLALAPIKQFPTGIVVAGAGAGVALTGLVIGLVARSQYNTAVGDHCPMGINLCNDGGKAANDARTLGNVGTVIGIVGLVGAGVGTYLWLSSRHHDEHARNVGVVVDRDRVGVFAYGRF